MHKQRFRILEFENPGGSKAWRVTGSKTDGVRVRENYANAARARARLLELELEANGAHGREITRPTHLTEEQLRACETAFGRFLGDVGTFNRAVDFWFSHGHKLASVAGNGHVGIDEAVAGFCAWVDRSELRPTTKHNLRSRARVFASEMGALTLDSLTPETIEGWLQARPVTLQSRRADLRVVRQFLQWAVDRPQRFLVHNVAKDVRLPRPETHEPQIYSNRQVMRLLVAARRTHGGRFLRWMALGFFGGLRPSEATRLGHNGINTADKELRLAGKDTKTKRARVIELNPTLAAWLAACPANGNQAPANNPTAWNELLRRARVKWIADGLRHTAISHFVRQSGRFADAATWAGNSEQIIRRHYFARTSSTDTAAFWALRPHRHNGTEAS